MLWSRSVSSVLNFAIHTVRRLIWPIDRWTSQRRAFGGKPLNQLAVIRSKLAAMIARTESLQAWLESVTYQMTHMNYKIQADKLAG